MDLEPIEERANEFSTWVGKFDSTQRIPAAFASAADVPALIAEVKRLHLNLDAARADRDNAVRDWRAKTVRPGQPSQCCCIWGLALSGEYPEDGCADCPVHQGGLADYLPIIAQRLTPKEDR